MRSLTLCLLSAIFVAASGHAGAFEIDDAVKADRDAVRQLQTQLNDLGFSVGGADGAFGNKTRGGIEGALARYGDPIAAGLTDEVVRFVDEVHASWFRSPFGGETAMPRVWSTRFQWVGETDIRNRVENCDACNSSGRILAVGDLNGDKRDEVVVGAELQDLSWRPLDRPSPISIFSPGSRETGNLFVGLPVADLPGRVHEREAFITDLNGDGVGDLFIAAHGVDTNPFPGEQNVLVLSGENGHTDVSATHLPQVDDMAHGAGYGDVDGDGDIDILVITNPGTTRTLPYFLINDGQGHFTRTDVAEFSDPELFELYRKGRAHRGQYATARFFDVNDDGRLDLLLAAEGDDARAATRYSGFRQSVLIYGDADGRWPLENAVELPTDRWGYATFTTDADAVDIDNDGDTDLVLTQCTRPGPFWRGQFIQVLINEDGELRDETPWRMWPQGYPGMDELHFPTNSFLVDIDNDGDLDLLTQNGDPLWKDEPGTTAYMLGLNDGAGRFTPVDETWFDPSADGYHGRELFPLDVDGDGRLELGSYSLNGDYGGSVDRTYGIRLLLSKERF